MTYSLVIPPELVSEVYHIREKTGKSIRMQILEAIKKAITQMKELEEQTVHAFTMADTLNKTNGGEKNGTTVTKVL